MNFNLKVILTDKDYVIYSNLVNMNSKIDSNLKALIKGGYKIRNEANKFNCDGVEVKGIFNMLPIISSQGIIGSLVVMGDVFDKGYEFCDIFNDKFVGDLEENYINFLEDIYEKELDRKSYVICWKQRVNNKTDVILRVGKEKKYISIKSGKNNSVHLETLDTFVLFLKEINCPDNIIEIYKEYHKGLDMDGNRIGGKEYQEKYPIELEKLNSFLNKPENIKPAIDRFLFQGKDKEI